MTALARLAQYALVIWVAATMNFALPHLAPGDPVQYLYGGDSLGLSPAQLAQIRAQYGLDQPLLTQYARFWTGLAHGDLGTSVSRNQPVLDVVARQLPWTLALVGCGLVLASVFGIGLGALAGWWRGTPKRGRRETAMLTGVLAVDSMPAFWVGMVLVAVFAVWLGWLPSYGALDIDAHGWALLGQVCQRLALPAATLGLAQLGAFFLLTRASMASVRDESFVRMARGLGMSERRVLFGAALPAALLPVATNASVELGRLLSGTVVIETVFAYPGLGRLIYDAVVARDYSLLSGTFLLVTVGVVLLNLVADLSYPLLDPRVRRARQVLG